MKGWLLRHMISIVCIRPLVRTRNDISRPCTIEEGGGGGLCGLNEVTFTAALHTNTEGKEVVVEFNRQTVETRQVDFSTEKLEWGNLSNM
ncbi:hypothetical protein OUZ56_004449 [Daphnia magna]|uniref:Uncharacterized protein n=1 Tax=Daphnia magna TaxID=35525 RepID=A0ABQ9YPX4_9CRUS|nr:hypothetical protein OUZ56_004449 [Daphnia magna]